jgi:hypothetical protein
LRAIDIATIVDIVRARALPEFVIHVHFMIMIMRMQR